MKKLLTFIVGSAVSLGAYAQYFDSGDLSYYVVSPDEKTCAVSGYLNLGSTLEIPEKVDFEGEEYAVTEIGWGAFSNSKIESVSLPSTLEVICGDAFWDCNNLTEVVIPNSVKEIGSDGFGSCDNLTSVQLGSSVEVISWGAFRNDRLNSVVALGETPARLDAKYSEIFPSNPFIVVSENLVATYKAAWKDAYVVTNNPAESISFDPDRYTVQPGSSVQLNCVLSPANAAVRYTTQNTDIISVDENGVVTADRLKGGYYVEVTATTLNGLTAVCSIETEQLEQFTIDGITYAVMLDAQNEVGVIGCNYDVDTAIIPETVEYDGTTYSVTAVSSFVFYWNYEIKEISIPASVKSIGKYSFSYCYNLKKLTIADSDKPLELSDYCLTGNRDLPELYVGRTLTYSKDVSYSIYSSNLAHLILGPQVTSLPDNIFRECGNLNLIESKNPVPPALGEDVFGWNSLSIVVPAASVEAYQSAWTQYAPYITAAIEAESLSFETEEFTLYPEQRIKLPLIVEPADAQILWESSNSELVRVDSEGNIEYANYWWDNNVGEVVISATTLNGLTAECKVTAKYWLTFSENKVSLTPDETYQVEVTKPEEVTEPISWRSNKESVAIVDEDGKITAVAYGNATIYASVTVLIGDNYYGFEYPIEVNVRNLPTSVNVENPEVTVFKDYDTYFNVVIEPQDDEYLNREMTWTVADPEIAEIELNWNTTYRVRGLEAGKTTATGTTVNGLTVEVELTVLPRIEDFTFATNATYMTEGQTRKLEFTTDPEETYQTYTYTSGDENVVTIDENGVMTAHGLGETYVYVEYKTPWGTNSRSHRVNVVIAPENVQFIDGQSDYEGQIGYWTWFKLEFTPDNYEVSRHIDWTDYDTEIVYIDTDNSFIGYKFGTTAFKGVAVNGDVLEGTITIAGLNVLEDGNRIWSKSMQLDEEFTFDIEASSAALLANVTVESSNTDVVTVTENGVVTAVGYGRATVYVRSWEETANGIKNYSYSFDVTVYPEEGFVFSTPKATLTPWSYQYLQIITAPNLWDGDLNLTWESTDENVVYVESYGQSYAYIRYAGPGYATITATDENGNGVATCEVTCYGIEMAEENVVMDTNSNYQLEAVVTPDDADVEFEWFSFDNEVVTVDENGLLTSYGVATNGYPVTVGVRAIVNGREMYAYCGVEVEPLVYVPVEDVLLDQPFISEEPGTYYQLTATINPEDATNKALIWKSDDESVATVDQDGLVYIVSYGFTLITVTSVENPDASAMCLVIGGASGVEGLLEKGDCDIFDMNGIVIKKSATVDDYNQLAPGIYLIRKGNAVIKIKR